MSQVTVDRPDVQGRVRILKVHSRGKQIGKDVDFEKIARRTPGRFAANALKNVSSWVCYAVMDMLHSLAYHCSGFECTWVSL